MERRNITHSAARFGIADRLGDADDVRASHNTGKGYRMRNDEEDFTTLPGRLAVMRAAIRRLSKPGKDVELCAFWDDYRCSAGQMYTRRFADFDGAIRLAELEAEVLQVLSDAHGLELIACLIFGVTDSLPWKFRETANVIPARKIRELRKAPVGDGRPRRLGQSEPRE